MSPVDWDEMKRFHLSDRGTQHIGDRATCISEHCPPLRGLTATVTVRRGDLELAIQDIGFAHANYCVSPCSCEDVADRLTEALDAAVDHA